MANELNKSEKAKSILAKIAEMFKTVEHKFLDYTLADGTTVISLDKLEVGGMVTSNGVPVAEGSYVLSDGTTIVADAMGTITSVTPKAAQAAPVAAPAPVPAPAAAAPVLPDLTTPAGMLEAYEKFTTGNPDSAGMNVIIKALMEYCFGWQLREAQEKATRDAALAVYQEGIAKTVEPVPTIVEQSKATQKMMKEMFALMTEVLGMPTEQTPGATAKKKFSFVDTDGRKKTFAGFIEAANKMREDQLKAV